jgi:hypothetical protein
LPPLISTSLKNIDRIETKLPPLIPPSHSQLLGSYSAGRDEMICQFWACNIKPSNPSPFSWGIRMPLCVFFIARSRHRKHQLGNSHRETEYLPRLKIMTNLGGIVFITSGIVGSLACAIPTLVPFFVLATLLSPTQPTQSPP